MVVAYIAKVQWAMVTDQSQQKGELQPPPFFMPEGPEGSYCRMGTQREQRGYHHGRCIYCTINKEHESLPTKFTQNIRFSFLSLAYNLA